MMPIGTRLRPNALAAAAIVMLLACLLCAATAGAVPIQLAQAQRSAAAAVEELQSRVRRELEEAALALEAIKTKVEASSHVDATLAELKAEADNVTSQVAKAQAELDARAALVDKRLSELGAAPAEGQTEDPALAEDRKRLQSEKAQINSILGDCQLLGEQADDLSDHITDLRRTLFAETIFRHTEVNAELFEDAWAGARGAWHDLSTITSTSLEFMWRFKQRSLFLALGATLVFAGILAVVLRRFLLPLIDRDPALQSPDYVHRLSVAFWSATVPTLAAGFVITCGLGFLYSFNVLREEMFDILRAAAWAGVGVYYVLKLAHGVVSPTKPQWRLFDVSDNGARRLVTFVVVLAAINGIIYVLGESNVALDAPLALTVVEGLAASVATGVVLILLSFVKLKDEAVASGGPGARLVRFTVLAVGIAIILVALFGYIGLARFASSQIVVTGAVLVTMYVGFLTGHTILQHNAFGRTALGQMLGRRYGFGEIRLDQLGLLAGLLVYVAVLFMGVPMVMLTWGFAGTDISGLLFRLFTEIRVGNITISLVGILVGILLFFVGIFATRWFQRWLDGNVMARSHIDTGVRNSIHTVLGYTGIVLAGLLAVSAAGFNLSSLALIAGALSLGVGFGLQTIVQNFVSGLILLAERPFKVGDWIVNGPVEGFVRRISVRATEIETFQNQSIIVPNSQLINAAVGNWTLRNGLARSEIPVSVSLDSDPRQVMDILLELARSHPLVLTMPEPNVGFQSFGQSSFDFELRFYVADIFQGGQVRNDIRVAIVERFRREGIVMPVPQRDLNVRVSGPAAALEAALSEEGLPPEVIARVVERAEGSESRPRRGRRVDLADDEDGSPYDGMHHALRDDDDDDGGSAEEAGGDARQAR